MRVEQLRDVATIRPVKHSAGETPHLTIETNRTCNITCRLCYATDRTGVKTLDEVRGEIELGLSKRNLEAITLLGGEPTLHPDLPAIVAYVKSKGLVCQILTNGLVFLEASGEELLDRLVAARVDRVIVHVDSGQDGVHTDPEAPCDQVFAMLERRQTHFARCITIYDDNRATIPALIERYGSYRYFDGILSMIATEVPGGPPSGKRELEQEHYAISRELGVEPTAVLPSSSDDGRIAWLTYFFYRNERTGATFGVSPRLYRTYMKVVRRLTGRHVFATTSRPDLYPVAVAIAGAFDVATRPQRILELLRLLRRSSFTRALRLNHIVIQRPPELDSKQGVVQLCYHCPDATVRNGVLTPVCLADRINPQRSNGSAEAPRDPDLARTVYRHLEETEPS